MEFLPYLLLSICVNWPVVETGLFIGWMPFLSPNQQHQSTEWLLIC